MERSLRNATGMSVDICHPPEPRDAQPFQQAPRLMDCSRGLGVGQKPPSHNCLGGSEGLPGTLRPQVATLTRGL